MITKTLKPNNMANEKNHQPKQGVEVDVQSVELTEIQGTPLTGKIRLIFTTYNFSVLFLFIIFWLQLLFISDGIEIPYCRSTSLIAGFLGCMFSLRSSTAYTNSTK